MLFETFSNLIEYFLGGDLFLGWGVDIFKVNFFPLLEMVEGARGVRAGEIGEGQALINRDVKAGECSRQRDDEAESIYTLITVLFLQWIEYFLF